MGHKTRRRRTRKGGFIPGPWIPINLTASKLSFLGDHQSRRNKLANLHANEYEKEQIYISDLEKKYVNLQNMMIKTNNENIKLKDSLTI